MSIKRNTYLIFGYDLSDKRDELLTEEFMDDDDNESFYCNHRCGQVQMFDDPMSGGYLYYGYIAASFDEYYDAHEYITAFNTPGLFKDMVDEEAKELPAVWQKAMGDVEFSIIAFVEYT